MTTYVDVNCVTKHKREEFDQFRHQKFQLNDNESVNLSQGEYAPHDDEEYLDPNQRQA